MCTSIYVNYKDSTFVHSVMSAMLFIHGGIPHSIYELFIEYIENVLWVKTVSYWDLWLLLFPHPSGF